MASQFVVQTLGTIILWLLSGALALVVALVLASGSLHRGRVPRAVADAVITLTRGVPTSLLVVSAGIIALGYPAPAWLPDPFSGTAQGMALVGWAVTIALAFGSTGHFAVIFRTGYRSLGAARHEQANLLGLGPLRRLRLMAREAAPSTLAPTGSRLVHHLHNTAFAALFPVADLFGWVQQRANETFDISRYAMVGVTGYVTLSVLIWALCRGLEHWLGLPATRAPRTIQA
jgi:ABC-type amino acid transport system permease subunit